MTQNRQNNDDIAGIIRAIAKILIIGIVISLIISLTRGCKEWASTRPEGPNINRSTSSTEIPRDHGLGLPKLVSRTDNVRILNSPSDVATFQTEGKMFRWRTDSNVTLLVREFDVTKRPINQFQIGPNEHQSSWDRDEDPIWFIEFRLAPGNTGPVRITLNKFL